MFYHCEILFAATVFAGGKTILGGDLGYLVAFSFCTTFVRSI